MSSFCYARRVAPSPTAEPTSVPRELRADAANNRRRILEAARAVFAERGIDAPFDEIARQAGVGNATLYRRFPTRDLLVATVFEERVAEYAGEVRDRQFPAAEHCYSIDEDELAHFLAELD